MGLWALSSVLKKIILGICNVCGKTDGCFS